MPHLCQDDGTLADGDEAGLCNFVEAFVELDCCGEVDSQATTLKWGTWYEHRPQKDAGTDPCQCLHC